MRVRRPTAAVIALTVALFPAIARGEEPDAPSNPTTPVASSTLYPIDTPVTTSPYGNDHEIVIALDDDGNIVPADT